MREQYINKAALVAKIRKRLLPIIRDKHYDEWEEGQDSERIAILDIIDTLEVKEVDLEKGVKDYIYALPHSRTGIPGGWKCSWPEEEVIKIAKHFFELGLKSKGE